MTDAPVELSVITKAYDLCLWFLPLIAKLPRSYHFTLGDRLQAGLLDVMDKLIRAKYAKAKLPILAECNVRLEVLRHQVRLCRDRQALQGSRPFPRRAAPHRGPPTVRRASI